MSMDATGPTVVERAHPSPSRVSVEGWPLRWKVAAIMVLPVLLAATFGALRIQNELSAASKLSIASGNAAIVVPAVEFVDRLDGLASAAAAGTSTAEPLTQFDASASTFGFADDVGGVHLRRSQRSLRRHCRGRNCCATRSLPMPRRNFGSPNKRRVWRTASATAITTSMASVDDVDVRPLADRLVQCPCSATGTDDAAGPGCRAGVLRLGRAENQGGRSRRRRGGGDRSTRAS